MEPRHPRNLRAGVFGSVAVAEVIDDRCYFCGFILEAHPILDPLDSEGDFLCTEFEAREEKEEGGEG